MSTVDISVKNTKNEILDAYHETLQQLREAKKASKQEIKQTQEKQATVQIASNNTAEAIVKHLADLKLSMVHSLEELSNQLLQEHKKLITLCEAIEIQEKELEELHEIKVNTDTLTALLQTQKQKKESFEKEMSEQRQALEQEMSQKKLLWKKEQEETEQVRKEQESQQKKLRQREEEEYTYKRDLERQKEQDQYKTQQQLLEKEWAEKKALADNMLAERESAISAREQTFDSLTTQVQEFPGKLQTAIEETEKAITERLQFKYDYEAKLTQKGVEGERSLHQQMITALEAKIVQQEKLIRELTEKANHAGMQVQDIAVKAIDGASRQRFYAPYPEKTADTVKG